MKSHRWEVLTHGGEVVRGEDSFPKPGVRDATRALKLTLKHLPTALKVIVPTGADLIFFRSTELKKEVGADGRFVRDIGAVVTYTLGYALAEKKSVIEVGWTEERTGIFSKKIIAVGYVLLSDDDGRSEQG